MVTAYSIDAEIDGNSAVVVKRNTASIIVNNGIVYLNDLGIKADGADFTQERVITIRVRPAP